MEVQQIKVLIVDDHYATRVGLKIFLESDQDIAVIAEAENGNQALEFAEIFNPHVVIMDLTLPGKSGVETALALKAKMPQQKILVLTGCDDDKSFCDALNAGVDGYCLKDRPGVQIAAAVRAISKGAGWLDPLITKPNLRNLFWNRLRNSQRIADEKYALSQRENEILRLIVDGLSNQEIANNLYLSSETIKTHVRHVFEKLEVTDRTQAAVKAIKEGLVRDSNDDALL